jgi:uncharacterized membrane protein YoaK (UPF0700 family)
MLRVAIGPFYALSIAAGCIDAISFVGLGQVFTANMTGNMVLLGIAVVSRFGTLPITIGWINPLIAIVTFIAGALAPLPLFPAGLQARRAALVSTAEGVLITVAALTFALVHASFVTPLCIALLGFAMGAQSMLASKAGLPGISTTYVTGTLITALTRGLSHGATDEHRRDAILGYRCLHRRCIARSGPFPHLPPRRVAVTGRGLRRYCRVVRAAGLPLTHLAPSAARMFFANLSQHRAQRGWIQVHALTVAR